jgi:alpha-tubulin suppressor-like RCC1 family protein
VAAGTHHSLALTSDGRVFQWGQGNFLQPSPVPMCYVDGGRTAEPLRGAFIAAGDGVSAVIDLEGRLFAWGRGLSKGKLPTFGFGNSLPSLLEVPDGSPVGFVSLGSSHGGAITGSPIVRSPPSAALQKGHKL